MTGEVNQSPVLRYALVVDTAPTGPENLSLNTIAPALTGVSPGALGAPNHNMVTVTVPYSAADASGSPVCSISVSSNEPTDGRGDGHSATDWQVLDGHTVLLRAERSGRGTGRIYTLTVSCTDGSGNTASAAADVGVSK